MIVFLNKDNEVIKIYCAGPLFNAKEREEMAEIADALEKKGLNVFLPHRDGFEFANFYDAFIELGYTEAEANEILNKTIFTLDVFQVLNSNGLILNINGRVPDEGAMVEAGIAWNAGKKVVIYKNDSRTLLNGVDNPLLLGLGNFQIVDDILKIPDIFIEFFSNKKALSNSVIDNSYVEELFKKGEQIAMIAGKEGQKDIICRKLIDLFGD
jgi:nucleoside 2-deoxyribosyltransferase